MQFTVSSRGRPIGVTDLGFVRFDSRHRSGWLHPNAEGGRLIPVIASVLPAMRAYLARDVTGEDGRPIGRPELRRTTEFADLADLAEALHHAGSLDLALHLEDGSHVPTEEIGIQDTGQLLAPCRRDEAEDEEEMFGGWADEEVWDEIEAAVEADLLFSEDPVDRGEPWTPDDEPAVFPRYQIHARLAEGATLPDDTGERRRP